MSRKLREALSFVAGWVGIGWMIYHDEVSIPALTVCALATGVAGVSRAIDLWHSVDSNGSGRRASSSAGSTRGSTSDG